MREREEISRQKSIEHAVRLHKQEAELQKARAHVSEMEKRHEEELHRYACDQETESQMADQILQYEKEVLELKDANTNLVCYLV